MAALTRPEMPILRETADQIYQRMVNRMNALAAERGDVPPSTEEGEFHYDLLYPNAEEISEQQQLLEYGFLQGFLPWADGEFLDAHGVWLGLSRLEGETDEIYRGRLLAKAAEEEGNGSQYDYTRWAKEIGGVGEVFVWGEPPNTVHLAITDMAGLPASPQLVSDLQAYLSRPDKHHMNDHVVVSAAEAINLAITGAVELAPGVELAQVQASIESGIRKYVKTNRQKLLFSEIYHLFRVDGVIDYKEVRINGADDNITITFAVVPVVSSVVVTKI